MRIYSNAFNQFSMNLKNIKKNDSEISAVLMAKANKIDVSYDFLEVDGKFEVISNSMDIQDMMRFPLGSEEMSIVLADSILEDEILSRPDLKNRLQFVKKMSIKNKELPF